MFSMNEWIRCGCLGTTFVTPVTCHFWLVLLNPILHCICFKMHFTESKYLTYKWSYTRLIRTLNKGKNCIKSLSFSSHRNNLKSWLRYNKIILGNKGLYSVSNKINGIKIGLQLMANSQTPAELKNCKLENPFLLFVPLAQYRSRKWQATGFEHLCHILYSAVLSLYKKPRSCEKPME